MEERQEKEFQEKVDDMFAPNGSPMSYGFKQSRPVKSTTSPRSLLGLQAVATPSSVASEAGAASIRRPKTQEGSTRSGNKIPAHMGTMNSFRPLHKFGEYIPSGSYAYPI